MKIVSSNKLAEEGGVKIVVHGAAGMGKTMLAASCPKPLLILTEKTGADSLTEENIRKVYGNQKGITYDIPVVEAYSTADIEKAINFARESDEYQTIVIDSVSELSKLRLKEERPNHKNQLQAYGMMAEDVDNLLRSMRDDDKNWLFLFQSGVFEVYSDDGEASHTQFVPGFEGQKLKVDFPYLLGDVYCMVAEFDDEGIEKRMLRTRQGDTVFYSKNRRGKLKELEPPHIGRIFWKLTRKSKTKSK